MGKIVRKGVEYGGSSNSADCIKYNDTKSVKEAIDEIKAGSSSNPTAASVTFDNTDTGLTAANVQDAVTEINGRLTQVEDRVEPCEIGNVYNFPTTDGATYVAPTDGYIFVNGGGTISVLNTYSRISSTVDSDNMVFIRKGMRLKRSGSSGLCRFISLA